MRWERIDDLEDEVWFVHDYMDFDDVDDEESLWELFDELGMFITEFMGSVPEKRDKMIGEEWEA